MAYLTATLSGTYEAQIGGTPAEGYVEIIPSEKVIKDTAGNVILTGRRKITLDATGSFTTELPATDDASLNPTGFGYTIVAKLRHQHLPAVSFTAPAGSVLTVEDLTPVDPSTFVPTTTYAESSTVAALDARVTTLETTPTVTSYNDLTDTPVIPATAADVGAEPAGLSAATDAALRGTYEPRVPRPIAGHDGPYRPWSGIYNLKASNLRRIRAALGRVRVGTGYAKVATLGDSTVAGIGTPDVSTGSWPGQLVGYLQDRGYPSSGSGVVTLYREAATDSRWSIPAAWDNYGRVTFRMGTDAAGDGPAVFTSINTGTEVDVFYNGGGGAFTVSIDGAAPVTVTPTGGDTLGTYTATGLPNTTHTVTLAYASGVTASFFGVSVRNGTSGVTLLNGGIGGMYSADLNASHWSHATAYAATVFDADLIAIMCMVNDTGAGVTPATQKANIQAAIIDAKVNGADVVLVTGAPWGTMDLSPYVAAHYELADENDLPLLDLTDRWNDVMAENDALGLMADPIHPNGAGYADIAVALGELILAS